MAENYKRKGDNLNKVNVITSIVIAIAVFFLGYIILPMESRITKRLDKMENRQEEQLDKFMNYYNQCKDDINDVRQEYQKDIRNAIEKLYAWFRQRDNNESYRRQ